jgi:hypothetical protein
MSARSCFGSGGARRLSNKRPDFQNGRQAFERRARNLVSSSRILNRPTLGPAPCRARPRRPRRPVDRRHTLSGARRRAFAARRAFPPCRCRQPLSTALRSRRWPRFKRQVLELGPTDPSRQRDSARPRFRARFPCPLGARPLFSCRSKNTHPTDFKSGIERLSQATHSKKAGKRAQAPRACRLHDTERAQAADRPSPQPGERYNPPRRKAGARAP